MRKLLFPALAVLAVSSFAISPAFAGEGGTPNDNSAENPAAEGQANDTASNNADGNNENSDKPGSTGSENAHGDNETSNNNNPNR